MKLNNKGYSMIELFAVIFIASVIIFPLVSTLYNNFAINERIHNRRSASSIAQGTLDGFNRFTYLDIETLVEASNSGGTYYIEFDSTNCNQLPDSADEALCDQLFQSIFNNLTLDNTEFQVYIHNYNLTTAMQNSLTANNNIPQEIRDEIATYTTTTSPNPDLYYIYVWIEYDEETNATIVQGGLLSDE